MRLKSLMQGRLPTLLMEAHDPISALVAQKAGFDGIWASSLSMSTAWGVRDSNELPWNLVLTVLEYMAERVHIPILVDGDSGHGNFNNFRIFCRKLARLGIAGVCIEDKLFPKANSFRQEGQQLAAIGEMQGKIRAAKDHVDNPAFTIIARTEALVSGLSMEEALARAHAYREAGADAILIHSKARTGEQIFEFCRHWREPTPLVIVPTTYHTVSASDFAHTSVKLMICANQSIRASIKAMDEACRAIRRAGTVHVTEESVASLGAVFGMLEYAELEMAEQRYAADTEAVADAADPHETARVPASRN